MRTQIDEYTIWSGSRRYVAVAETFYGFRATGPERTDRDHAEHDLANLVYEAQRQEQAAQEGATK